MFSELHDFDIFPKVFLTEENQHITVSARGSGGCTLDNGEKYILTVREAERSVHYDGSGASRVFEVTADENGRVYLDCSFPREGMYFIEISREGRCFANLRVYTLERDMAGLYPYRGDLHMHTCCSDGHNTPEAVASDYRSNGYDFTVISDHNRFYPSLELRRKLRIGADDKSDITDLLIVQGEEVHLPLNPAHYVNFGGSFSINALVTPSANGRDRSDNPCDRSLDGKCPDTIAEEDFVRMIEERAKKVPLPLESERKSYAVLEWIYGRMKENGGLGIFPHPYWLCPTMQLSEDFTRYIYENHPFDAFEVLGGENYYQHNGFQTAFYYDMKTKGFDYPVVGSTDSHGSTENNRNAMICSTIVFSPENTVPALVSSIKAKRSVAVDTISAEYRLVGDFRFVKYGSFLMENWFPIHDLACRGEGFWLSEYCNGNPQAEGALKANKGIVPSMLKKYFNV